MFHWLYWLYWLYWLFFALEHLFWGLFPPREAPEAGFAAPGPLTRPGLPAIAARLRREGTLSVKTIAARVHLVTPKSANARLHAWLGLAAASDPNQGRLQM